MAAVGHFGCPKFTFDRISGHFRSMCKFFFDKMASFFSFTEFCSKNIPGVLKRKKLCGVPYGQILNYSEI